MDIRSAMEAGRRLDRAIRRSSNPTDYYLYHGMDNVMYSSHNKHEVTWSVAMLLADDYEISDVARYHGEKIQRTADIEYYQSVCDTQTDPKILKAELQDLINELRGVSNGRKI